jgi:chromosome segregation protein
MLIREVILENFMSYEYARVPVRDGVNVVCGPNGSGKSSFLTGICIALGDTYTERSKKLSDLIRWGEDRARVSLLLDNTANDGQRPIPRFDSNVIRLTRNLRRDGKYWFEINQKGAQKYEVMNILNDLGFDPSNMLIVMHQNMPTQFAALPPREKLKILESAVGFESYRSDVVEAKTKLGGILSEESSLINLLDRARETLNYWREQNDRLQVKKQHQSRNVFLQKEIAWSRVIALEKEQSRVEQDITRADNDLHEAEAEMERNGNLILDSNKELENYKTSWIMLIEKRVKFERTVGICEYTINNSKGQLSQLGGLLESSSENRKRFKMGTENLRNSLKAGPTTLDDYFNILAEIEESQSEAYKIWNSEIEDQRTKISSSVDSLGTRLEEAKTGALAVVQEMERTRIQIDETNDKYIEARIRMALLRDRRGRLSQRIDSLRAEMDRLIRDLNDAEVKAIIKGARVETGRSSEEILGEIRKVSGILMGMADVTDNAEEMYVSYSRTFNELQERVDQVRLSRHNVMEEIEQRTKRWRGVMQELLVEVNGKYLSLLSMLQAKGEVRLIDATDIEEAGLEIWVGFKGAVPSRLDPFTHSGGERSTSVMAFLLSLQQNIRSPFRAVDEFDLHMDPKNKEVVSEFIVKTMKGSDDQYLAITPSQITFQGKDNHIILIHKTEGRSTVQVVE